MNRTVHVCSGTVQALFRYCSAMGNDFNTCDCPRLGRTANKVHIKSTYSPHIVTQCSGSIPIIWSIIPKLPLHSLRENIVGSSARRNSMTVQQFVNSVLEVLSQWRPQFRWSWNFLARELGNCMSDNRTTSASRSARFTQQGNDHVSFILWAITAVRPTNGAPSGNSWHHQYCVPYTYWWSKNQRCIYIYLFSIHSKMATLSIDFWLEVRCFSSVQISAL